MPGCTWTRGAIRLALVPAFMAQIACHVEAPVSVAYYAAPEQGAEKLATIRPEARFGNGDPCQFTHVEAKVSGESKSSQLYAGADGVLYASNLDRPAFIYPVGKYVRTSNGPIVATFSSNAIGQRNTVRPPDGTVCVTCLADARFFRGGGTRVAISSPT